MDTNNTISMDTITSTIVNHDHKKDINRSCVIYKFNARPPYEGFILILLIVVIAILLIYWLTK